MSTSLFELLIIQNESSNPGDFEFTRFDCIIFGLQFAIYLVLWADKYFVICFNQKLNTVLEHIVTSDCIK